MSYSPLKITAVVFVIAVLLAAGISFVYWRSLTGTPQYSLALMIDAARNGDDRAVEAAIDIDAVVDDLVPQIAAKAAEMYGRGLPPGVISRLAAIAAPIMPVVKERARVEVPGLIREQAKSVDNVPFPLLVIGIDRYFDVKMYGDRAIATSRSIDREIELTMLRDGDNWRIVGLKDDIASTEIARQIGEQIIAFAMNGGEGSELKIDDLNDLIRKAERLIR